MKKIYIVYKFTNTITGDFYIGSRKDIKKSLANHKYQPVWIVVPNDQLYQDIQKYGVDKFSFEILAEVEADSLKETEQQFIERLNPTYNNRNADGLDTERKKEYNKEYKKEYKKTNKYKQYKRKYQNQLCNFNGETLTLNALRMRFRKQGIDHPTLEAKKYLKKEQNTY